MATRADFTPEEWTKVQDAPTTIALYVISASPSSPLGFTQELTASLAALLKTQRDASAPQILQELVADVLAQQAASEPQPGSERPEELRALMLSRVQEAALLIDAKTGADAPAIKQWLYSLGDKVARAAKESGFLDTAETLVSAEEQAALAELAATLGARA